MRDASRAEWEGTKKPITSGCAYEVMGLGALDAQGMARECGFLRDRSTILSLPTSDHIHGDNTAAVVVKIKTAPVTNISDSGAFTPSPEVRFSVPRKLASTPPLSVASYGVRQKWSSESGMMIFCEYKMRVLGRKLGTSRPLSRPRCPPPHPPRCRPSARQ